MRAFWNKLKKRDGQHHAHSECDQKSHQFSVPHFTAYHAQADGNLIFDFTVDNTETGPISTTFRPKFLEVLLIEGPPQCGKNNIKTDCFCFVIVFAI